jgi:glycosyltransferase involved in cell wall biosynthesis
VVLIPYYNDWERFSATLAGMAGGPRVLVVDDGSRVPLRSLLTNVHASVHVEILTLSTNGGIVAALNAGIERILQSDAQFIARLDCGDVSESRRWQVQRRFLIEHGSIAVVGSWVRFTKSGAARHEGYVWRGPLEPPNCLRAMPFGPTLIHPSVMFRRDVLSQGFRYSSNYPHAEDYELFWRIASSEGVANIPEVLTVCTFDDGISSKQRRAQTVQRLRILWLHRSWSWRWTAGLSKTLLAGLLNRRTTAFLLHLSMHVRSKLSRTRLH